MNTESIGCFLQITGETDHFFEDISKLINLKPSEIHHKGEAIDSQHPKRVFEHHIWAIESALEEDDTEEAHVDALIDELLPYQDGLRELAKKYELHLEIYGTKYNPHVGIFIDHDKMNALNSMGISLGISIYCLAPHFLDNEEQVTKLKGVAATLQDDLDPTYIGDMVDSLAIIEQYSGSFSDAVEDLLDDYVDIGHKKERLDMLSTQLQLVASNLKKFSSHQ